MSSSACSSRLGSAAIMLRASSTADVVPSFVSSDLAAGPALTVDGDANLHGRGGGSLDEQGSRPRMKAGGRANYCSLGDHVLLLLRKNYGSIVTLMASPRATSSMPSRTSSSGRRWLMRSFTGTRPVAM